MSVQPIITSLSGYKRSKATQRAFREWRRLFQTLHDLDEKTRWEDLPDWMILFLSEQSPEGRLTVYDLLMGGLGLGSGHHFETLPAEKLMPLMDVYFVIMDQIHFECMRRLGWVESIPWAEKSIMDQIIEARNLLSPFLLKPPAMTPGHPAFNEITGGDDFDYGRLLRMHIPDAWKAFRNRMNSKTCDEKRLITLTLEKRS